MHIVNWRDREIETAIEETFTKLGYPTANPEELEAGKEIMKGKDVFFSMLESPSATVVCHLCLTL